MYILTAIKTWIENIQKEMAPRSVKGKLVYVLHIPHTWSGVGELAARDGYTLKDDVLVETISVRLYSDRTYRVCQYGWCEMYDVFYKYYKHNIKAWQETGDEHFIREYITWKKENDNKHV